MTEKSFPTQAQVVIIGGGVIGCSVAYHLTKLGWRDVVLLERRSNLRHHVARGRVGRECDVCLAGQERYGKIYAGAVPKVGRRNGPGYRFSQDRLYGTGIF